MLLGKFAPRMSATKASGTLQTTLETPTQTSVSFHRPIPTTQGQTPCVFLLPNPRQSLLSLSNLSLHFSLRPLRSLWEKKHPPSAPSALSAGVKHHPIPLCGRLSFTSSISMHIFYHKKAHRTFAAIAKARRTRRRRPGCHQGRHGC